MNPDKSVLNKVEIDEVTHSWLINQANVDGSYVNDYAGAMLDAVADGTKNLSKSQEIRLKGSLSYRRLQRRQVDEIKAQKAAKMYLHRPTEQAQKDFEQVCESAGLDPEEVIKESQRNPYVALLSPSESPTLKEQCIVWLPSFILENGGEVASSTVYAAGRALGFSSSTIDRARQEINKNPTVPPIKSDKPGVGWVMSIRTNVQEEHHQHQQHHKDRSYTM